MSVFIYGSASVHEIQSLRTFGEGVADDFFVVAGVAVFVVEGGVRPDPGAAFADLPRRWRIGGEVLSLETDSPFYWESDGALVNQLLQKNIVRETYIITKVESSMDPASASGAHAAIINAGGKLNSTSWEGFAPGQWMYMGADIDEQYSSSGTVSYRVEHTFAARIIGTSDGWQKIWNSEFSLWDRVSTTQLFDRTKQNYEYTEFTDLF